MAVTRFEFKITFHGPFRVALGQGGPGVHNTISQRHALPGSSLKGVVRATAGLLLGTDNPVVAEVFGSSRQPCPWHWSSPVPRAHEPDEQPAWYPAMPSARVRIDRETHTAVEDMLVIAEQTGAESATFTVTQTARIDDLAKHQDVLVVAAQATRSLGSLRRRGLGWVGIACTSHEPDEDTVRRFLQLKQP
ncbi:RAMP superfamily CRISPR-associated protein [Saccharopolyspora elongata]|uniref:RAMP superfamily CRISPR-associated protein n=1 Tax=Saccharopolyspora elongata TaxID=2530387 RepID=UPI001F3070EF|nr:RAMP superfamily CRISPR-associated protein [Saccharopolyspora elongata]